MSVLFLYSIITLIIITICYLILNAHLKYETGLHHNRNNLTREMKFELQNKLIHIKEQFDKANIVQFESNSFNDLHAARMVSSSKLFSDYIDRIDELSYNLREQFNVIFHFQVDSALHFKKYNVHFHTYAYRLYRHVLFSILTSPNLTQLEVSFAYKEDQLFIEFLYLQKEAYQIIFTDRRIYKSAIQLDAEIAETEKSISFLIPIE